MDGLKGDSKESWKECESSVNSMLKERLVKQTVEIERAHRVRRKAEISREQLFVNSCNSNVNRIF